MGLSHELTPVGWLMLWVLPILRVETTDHELVVLKPAGLVSELPRNPAADSLVRRLEHDGFPSLRLVHRLDAPTCGLVVVARSAAAAAHYASEIAGRRWHKFYVARVAVPATDACRLVGAHKAYLKTDGPIARVVRAGGKPAFLDVLDVAPAPAARGCADLLVRLHTGRFHQIRAMLAHLGAPLAGDARYGGPVAPRFYLEHVMLGARPAATTAWRVWRAPAHDDRPPWDDALTAALQQRRDLLERELALRVAH